MMKVGLTNSKLSDAERAAMGPEELHRREVGSKIYMAGWSTYTAVVVSNHCTQSLYTQIPTFNDSGH